jgi:diaminohydroxyphosphoribosylaminopyrimidine deaminase/5-amino-6-(5-phosphoribosylamino)uracil reductase
VRRAALEAAGVEVAEAADLAAGLAVLHAREVQTVLCEGGQGLAGALLGAGLVDRMLVVTAPKLLGDPEAPGLIGATGMVAGRMDEATGLAALACEQVGEDLWIDAWLREPR